MDVVINEDSDKSDNDVIGDFTHLPRRISNSKTKVTAENFAVADNGSSENESLVPYKKY